MLLTDTHTVHTYTLCTHRKIDSALSFPAGKIISVCNPHLMKVLITSITSVNTCGVLSDCTETESYISVLMEPTGVVWEWDPCVSAHLHKFTQQSWEESSHNSFSVIDEIRWPAIAVIFHQTAGSELSNRQRIIHRVNMLIIFQRKDWGLIYALWTEESRSVRFE